MDSNQHDNPERNHPEHHLDGNALAGALEQFVADLTSADCMCAGCGSSAPLATALLYAQAPGMVLRCPSCTAVLMVLTDQGGRQVLTVDGIRHFTISTP